jgi:hypothetical protein
VDFERRADHEQIRTLLTIGAIKAAAINDFSFDAWEAATDEQLYAFADSVAGLSGCVARQQTGVPILTFLDRDGVTIKHLLTNQIESPFRRDYILAHPQLDRGMPQLFEQCFVNLQRLMEEKRWRPVPNYCRSAEDAPFIESRFAALAAGIECLIRNSLMDAGCDSEDYEGRTLSELIGAVKRKLQWEMPKHYTRGDRVRKLRNAVTHGDTSAFAPSEIRHELDKWSLFLMRRLLIRLGFDGLIRSPNVHIGEYTESPVDDFSEQRNSFQATP